MQFTHSLTDEQLLVEYARRVSDELREAWDRGPHERDSAGKPRLRFHTVKDIVDGIKIELDIERRFPDGVPGPYAASD